MTQPAPVRILVIDDEPAIYKLVKAILEKAGYEATAVAGAEEGLKFLSTQTFQAAITDAMMPGMDGFEFTRRVRNRQELKDFPILMLTRRRARNDVKQAIEAGVTDYLLKPIDGQLLLDKLAQQLSGIGRNGTRHVQEIDLHDERTRATVTYEAAVISLRESGLVLRSSFPMPKDIKFSLRSTALESIGIDTPDIKAGSSEPSADGRSFRTPMAFIGLEEKQLQKIRAWIQREAIRRKK